jgi:hypothetical protein
MLMGYNEAMQTKTTTMREVRESLARAIAFDSADWSQNKRMAWIYGVVLGWNSDAMAEVAALHNWNADTVARIRRLHAAFTSAQ